MLYCHGIVLYTTYIHLFIALRASGAVASPPATIPKRPDNYCLLNLTVPHASARAHEWSQRAGASLILPPPSQFIILLFFGAPLK